MFGQNDAYAAFESFIKIVEEKKLLYKSPLGNRDPEKYSLYESWLSQPKVSESTVVLAFLFTIEAPKEDRLGEALIQAYATLGTSPNVPQEQTSAQLLEMNSQVNGPFKFCYGPPDSASADEVNLFLRLRNPESYSADFIVYALTEFLVTAVKAKALLCENFGMKPLP